MLKLEKEVYQAKELTDILHLSLPRLYTILSKHKIKPRKIRKEQVIFLSKVRGLDSTKHLRMNLDIEYSMDDGIEYIKKTFVNLISDCITKYNYKVISKIEDLSVDNE